MTFPHVGPANRLSCRQTLNERCDECGLLTIGDGRGWQAHLTDDEPPEVADLLPGLRAREFSGRD